MSQEQSFAGQVVIVTGASRGVGRGLAIRLGELGAGVACVARATDSARFKLPGTVDETARAVEEAGGDGLAVPLQTRVLQGKRGIWFLGCSRVSESLWPALW